MAVTMLTPKEVRIAALAYRGDALASGEKDPLYLSLCVTDAKSGAPVHNLGLNHLTVNVMRPGATEASLTNIEEYPAKSGFFRVQMVREGNVIGWPQGFMHLAIVVHRTTATENIWGRTVIAVS